MTDRPFRVLQFDGGGILGITPAIVVARLEQALAQRTGDPAYRLRDHIDLCIGTSTGAILSGMLAAGVPAEKVREFYVDRGPDLFRRAKHTIPWPVKYDRERFVATIREVLKDHAPNPDPDQLLASLPKHLIWMATTFNLASRRTHFLKSDNAWDGRIKLVDAISWSALSAVYYFGKINVPEYTWGWATADADAPWVQNKGAVFQDGGQGTQNSTVGQVLHELTARGIDQAVIISLGTGNVFTPTPYAEVAKFGLFSQIRKFFGQARSESMMLQAYLGRFITPEKSGIRIIRLDYESPQDFGLDDLKHVDLYKAKGEWLATTPSFAAAVESLAG